MLETKTVTKADLEQRACWLAWRYNLDEKRILECLRRTKVEIEHVVSDGLFSYLSFDPSLEKALLYSRPEVALKVFETANLDDIRKWLTMMDELAGKLIHDWPGNEELCRWEAESYLLPD